MPSWTNFEDINRAKELRRTLRWPGVYKIQITDTKGNPRKIERFLGTDREGILGIGNSSNIGDRIVDFFKANEGTYGRHSVGSRAFLIRAFMNLQITNFGRNIYGNSHLMFAAYRVNTKEEAEIAEEALLKEYFLRYGELPPLNSALQEKHNLDWFNLPVIN